MTQVHCEVYHILQVVGNKFAKRVLYLLVNNEA